MPATLDQLREDHREALDKVDRASRALQAVGHGRPVETIRAALEDLIGFVDGMTKIHIPFEEETLFPILAGHDEMADVISDTSDANEALIQAIRQLKGELKAGRPDAGVILNAGNTLIRSMHTHIRLGDLFVHPFARRMLTRDQVEELELSMRERTALPPAYPLPIVEL